MPNLHGSLAPDALLSMKHIENSEWLPYSGPEGVCGGDGVPCQILPCTLPNAANTHMLDRTEQKPLSCCFYCFVSGTAVHFISIAFKSHKERLTKDLKPIVESRKKCGESLRDWAACTVQTLPSKAVYFPCFIPLGGNTALLCVNTLKNIILTWIVHSIVMSGNEVRDQFLKMSKTGAPADIKY